ncbi:MAG: type IV pilus modification protein PilV [Gammaproteobacteria bacterium]|nr:type IV pilus modification protein PilV [Gammaproteobacteria bacterium]
MSFYNNVGHLRFLPASGRRSSMVAGFTLVEVLVALLIMTLGIVGVLSLQTQSLKSNQRAYFRTQADILGKDVISRMQANIGEARDGKYVVDEKPAGPDCLTNTCTPSQLVKWDLSEWYTQLESRLPEGDASIELINGKSSQYNITIRWDDRRNAKTINKDTCGSAKNEMLCWGMVVLL